MKNSQKFPLYVEVELILRNREGRIVSAYADIVVSPSDVERCFLSGADIIPLLGQSLLRSLACYFPSRCLVATNVRYISPSKASCCLPFRGRNTDHIARNLAADILGQIL